MTAIGHDQLNTRRTLRVGNARYAYYSIQEAEKTIGDVSRLPFSLKVLLENLLRCEDGKSVTTKDIKAFAQWLKDRAHPAEIQFRPSRILMQDFTGVPAVVDLAAMREAMLALDQDPAKINPLIPVDMVIDHSVMVDFFAKSDAFARNADIEYKRNMERYAFLRWGSRAFKNFRVVPPGTGICHQVNLEYLSQVVWTSKDEKGDMVAYPDTLVGTDSHTTMVNGLGVLGWGVGGIEAEAAMLGQPISMLLPEVVGCKLEGKLKEGITATDLVLTVTQMLRQKGVVGRFVEFYGPGLDHLALADRATIANMAPEYGATCGFFPVDQVALDYMRFTGRDEDQIQLIHAYAQEQGLWRDASTPDPVFTDSLYLDLSSVVASLAGPKRPQDRVSLDDVADAFEKDLKNIYKKDTATDTPVPVAGADFTLRNGHIVIAAITSCTNTSNPSVMIAAGLVARKARALGLMTQPWVKSSLAPGSKVVTDYLDRSGLTADLDYLGFNLVGYGCTTCIGNSGPLPESISTAIHENDLVAVSILSGNRNFEGRISPDVQANYLVSPPLVIAYALKGSMRDNIRTTPIGTTPDGTEVFLKDIWPTDQEIAAFVRESLTSDMFRSRYAAVFEGDEHWQAIPVSKDATYKWDDTSTYVRNPPYFEGMHKDPQTIPDIKKAHTLAMLGDSITTDHISPAGAIRSDSPAGQYLLAHGVARLDFNSYGSRRGNHEVMMRGTFANIRIKNKMVPGTEGGLTKHLPSGEVMSIYDAAIRYAKDSTPLVIVAGKEYGTGSSRDWAAKGTRLLGVRAVIAESYERIHRSNLVGMGVLPLQFLQGVTAQSLGLDGSEIFDMSGLDQISPGQTLDVRFTRTNGKTDCFQALCRIDTENEGDYFRNGGILPYVLRSLAN